MATEAATQMRPSTKDWRPIILRNRTNLWTRAEKVRDDLYDQLSQLCRRDGIDPLLLNSPAHVFPAWVNFEVWQPQEDRGATERSSVLITIEPKPYHKHEFELEVTYNAQNKSRTLKRVAPFTDAEVQALVTHLVNRGPKPRFRRFREASLQFWRENNKIEGLRKDLLATFMGILAAGGFFLIATPPLGSFLALVLWSVAFFLYLQIRKRRWIVRNDGKPDSEPRSLIRVDSWQTVLFDLGAEEATVRERFVRALQIGLDEHRTFRQERIWYWGLEGKEEREQFILTAGRGIVFCQIYRYAQDLYVGWDGHLNRGQWVEQTVASGIDRTSGNPTSISRVVPGTQPTTEYDLTDLSSLMEWTHAQIVKLLKEMIAEKKIDQEIDFKIQRGERQQVAASGAATAAGGGVASKVRRAFQRTA